MREKGGEELALFYFTIGVSDNTFSLKEKLEKIRYEGANISYTIISSSHVILKINEIIFINLNLIIKWWIIKNAISKNAIDDNIARI